MKRGEGTRAVLEFTNTDNEKSKFRVDLMNPLLVSSNSFSQKCAALLVNSPRLLAAYISLLSNSEKFCNFNPEVHLANGMMKDGSMLVTESLVGLGGSLKEYEEFVGGAVENAVNVGGEVEEGNNLTISPALKKRKITDFYNKTGNKKKMSKTEVVEANYREMMDEDGGLERSLANSYS